MRNLIEFLIKSSSWILAFVLISISFYLIFTQNDYQRSVFLSSSNAVAGQLSDISNRATSVIYMQKDNEMLANENARLHEQLESLKKFIANAAKDSIPNKAFTYDSIPASQFHFIQANVVNKSFVGVNNYITVNKGRNHGITPDMGVISAGGVVGVVYKASNNFSIIIPIINNKFRLSAKLKNSDNIGSISWNGKTVTHAQLGQLQKYKTYHTGDSVVTSFSRIFPRGILIGTITNKSATKENNFNTVDVKLATDFSSLEHVLIINDKFFIEQNGLEQSVVQ